MSPVATTTHAILPPYLLFLGNATQPAAAHMAAELARWRPEWCVGQARLPGCRVDLGLPDLTLDQARAMGVRTLIVGATAKNAGLPEGWVQYLTKALDSGFDVAAGLPGRLAEWPSLYSAALTNRCRLHDVRHAGRHFSPATGARRPGRRALTIGTDSGVGALPTALAIAGEMQRRGFDASFRATGQTGILIGGDGLAIESLPADEITGAIEALCPAADPEHWDVVEGQGCLFNPATAPLSLALLHGAQPDALVLCHEPDRPHMTGLPDRPLPGLRESLQVSEFMARMVNPRARVVAISLDTAKFSAASAQALIEATAAEFALPCVDPLRTGVIAVVDMLTGP